MNEQLETAEKEIQAQRKELERAAITMEKDRGKFKRDKDEYQKRHLEEVKVLQNKHEQSMREQQTKYEATVSEYRTQLTEEENRRKQEGGNWDEREQEMRVTVSKLEDERAILMQQISTLTNQQSSLGLRCESLQQAADHSMEREREAQEQLDSALSLHASQITQRMERESNLERTIQELNAALVTSNGKVTPCGDIPTNSVLNTDISSMEARINTLEIDLQNEKNKVNRLIEQNKILSKEKTEESNTVHRIEIQKNREVSELKLQIEKLETQRRRESRVSIAETNDSTSVTPDDQIKVDLQLKRLQLEVISMREHHNSETSAMRSRLTAAIEKSKQLEIELDKRSSTDDKDRGNMNFYPTRRVYKPASIRDALLLSSSEGGISEVVDAIDSLSVQIGKFLRKNPFARLFFICYLVIMHLWIFILLMYHVHSVSSDIQTTEVQAHSPHVINRQSIERVIDGGAHN